MTAPEFQKIFPLYLEQERIPQYIFKYRTLGNDFDKILLNNELYFSNPKDFNDPFDCQIEVDTNNSILEIKEYINKVSHTKLDSNELTNLANQLVNDPEKWRQMVNNNVQFVIDTRGVCCFAGNNNNILLWSHYTDSHKGVCLKFDILKDLDLFFFPLKVNYSMDYPEYNYVKDQLSDKLEFVNKLIKTKSEVWAYEEEVRVVNMETGPQSFKKEALIEVIFGCKCSNSEINRIKQIATENGYNHINYKKAVLKRKEYGLDFITV